MGNAIEMGRMAQFKGTFLLNKKLILFCQAGLEQNILCRMTMDGSICTKTLCNCNKIKYLSIMRLCQQQKQQELRQIALLCCY